MKTLKSSAPLAIGLMVSLLLFTHCKKDILEDCTIPDSMPPHSEHCKTELQLDDIVTTGTIVETSNGAQITGDVTIPQGNTAPVFEDSELEVVTDQEGNVVSLTGTGTVPAADGYLAFDNPFQADIGYFTGKWLNENRDFCITLKDSISYFVYRVTTSFKMHVGGNNAAEAPKPVSIQVPIGGEILMIMNYDDPMFFVYGELDLLGAMGFGKSYGGNIVYEPDYPIDGFALQGFDGKMIRCASGKFGKFLKLSGSMVYNNESSADLLVADTNSITYNLESTRGLNARMELDLPFKKIESFAKFHIPLAEGSAAFTTSLSSQGGFESKAYLRGIQEADNSWWPDFIPIKLNNSTEITAFIEESGAFEASIEAKFGIKMPTVDRGLEGKATINNDAFTLEGLVRMEEEEWSGSASFASDKMEFIGQPPADYLLEFEQYAVELIDQKFYEADSILQKYTAANENYKFEVSLRGFRETLPGILKKALEIIDEQVAKGLDEARDKIREELKINNRIYGSDNLTSVVNNIVQPYKNTINDLIEVLDKADNATVRVELERLLRDLAGMRTINQNVTGSVTHYGKILGVQCCKRTDSRTVNVTINVLNDDQVGKLNWAANNIKYIKETSDIMISVKQVLDEFPSPAELNKLKDDIQSGVKQFLEIGGAGFTYTYKTKRYDFFLLYGGEKKPISDMDIFDGQALGELITFEY